MADNSSSPGMTWLYYALMTVFAWGVYGVILHKGRGHMPMGPETPHAGLKAFLFVCIAYALIGVVSALLLKARGSNWSFTSSGVSWSVVAGAVKRYLNSLSKKTFRTSQVGALHKCTKRLKVCSISWRNAMRSVSLLGVHSGPQCGRSPERRPPQIFGKGPGESQ
jgi:hypothetical protein